MGKRDKSIYSRILMVEGADDLFSVAHLMKAHVDWPDEPSDKWPVFIVDAKGVDNILESGRLTAAIKESHVQTYGVILGRRPECQRSL